MKFLMLKNGEIIVVFPTKDVRNKAVSGYNLASPNLRAKSYRNSRVDLTSQPAWGDVEDKLRPVSFYERSRKEGCRYHEGHTTQGRHEAVIDYILKERTRSRESLEDSIARAGAF